MLQSICQVCQSSSVEPISSVQALSWLQCGCCHAAWMADSERSPPVTGKSIQKLHANDPADAEYRDHLDGLVQGLKNKLKVGSVGLDYGCGPNPGLAQLLFEAGYIMNLYDPFYAPDPVRLDRTYDFIACNEVIEHFEAPITEFSRLNTLLKPGGWLGILSSYRIDNDGFENLRRRQDPAGIVFYSPETFQLIADRFGGHCEFPANNVVLIQKSV